MAEKSATLPCAQPWGPRSGKRVERAFYVQVAVPMRLPDAGPLPGGNLPQVQLEGEDKKRCRHIALCLPSQTWVTSL